MHTLIYQYSRKQKTQGVHSFRFWKITTAQTPQSYRIDWADLNLGLVMKSEE